jgi:hypothetical protein
VTTATDFTGEGVSFSVAGRGASVDPTTGVLSISTEALRDGVEITVTATSSAGSATRRFRVNLLGSAAPALIAPPALSGTGRVGEAVELDPGTWSGTPAPELAVQWRRDGATIPGATGLGYVPTAADDRTDLTALVTASNAAGSAAAETSPLGIVRAAPVALGALEDLALLQGSPARVEAARVFKGEALVYSVTGAGATVDAATGRVTVPAGTPLAATDVTVTATNSGGSASVAFKVTVAAWPANIAAADWTVAEVTDRAEAAAQGFPGESGRVKATFKAGIDADPAGFTLHWTPFGSDPDPNAAAVVPGTTQYSTSAGTVGTAYAAKVWWKHTATGTFKLAGTHAAITLTGLVIEPDTDLHPRTVFNASEFAIIRARVNANTQPQRNSWVNQVLPAANAGLNFTADPDASYGFQTGEGSGQGTVAYSRKEFWSNSTPAYACALAYKQTGDTRYADKAVQILDAWARRSPDINPTNGSHPGLHIGSFLVQFLYTVDLLRGYSGWEGAVHKRFETWIRNKPLVNVSAVITEKMAGWPGNRQTAKNNPEIWEGSNWLEAAINFKLAAGIAFEDDDMRDEMIDRTADHFIGRWRYTRKNYGPGGTSVGVINRDIDRRSGNTVLGITYTGYGTSSMVQTLEMCRYSGTNLWNAKTPDDDVGIQDIIEAWVGWNYLNDEFHHQLGIANRELEKDPRMHSNILEAANSNLTLSARVRNYVLNNRPILGCPRDDFPTFTRV